MTIIALHGNFETPLIWSEFVVACPGRVITPDLWQMRRDTAGGPPLDADGIVDAIATLVRAELAEGPVDLVGRNLSSAMVLRLVSKHPGHVRSFCVDAIGWTHPNFTFAPMTAALATRRGQEEFRATFIANDRKGLRAAIALSGISSELSDELGQAVGGAVVDASLALCEESPVFRTRWREELGVIDTPGLVFNLARPLFGDRSLDAAATERLGLKMVSLNMGRLWCATHPNETADIITAFTETVTLRH